MKRKYEIGFMLNPEISEEEVKKISDNVLDMIKKAKGKVENVDEWGRRPLAYPIQKHNEGIFTFINTEAEGMIVGEIERRLNLNEKVMRYVILRLDDKLKRANKLTKKWQKIERMTRKTQEAGKGNNVTEEFLEEKEKKDEN
jgi:small subunit ribosomal protein S6